MSDSITPPPPPAPSTDVLSIKMDPPPPPTPSAIKVGNRWQLKESEDKEKVISRLVQKVLKHRLVEV